VTLSALLAVSAGLLAAPMWTETPFMGFQDYPTQAVRNEWSAAVQMDLLVAPDGEVVKCTPLAGFGDEDFASMFCAIASRKRAEPARDLEGNPTFGVRREFVRLFLQGTGQGKLIADLPPPRADLEFEVQSLPGTTASSVRTNVVVAVDESGKVVACEPGPSTAEERYGKAACGQVIGTDLPALTDNASNPTAYVRLMRVEFTAAGSPPN
jgi:hypothetical protein